MASKVDDLDVAFVDVAQAMVPGYEDDFALLFGSELLFQPVQFHTKISKKMYEILGVYHQTEVPTVPTLSRYVRKIDVPATTHYGSAQSARHKFHI
jgi:hypothetical protein